MKIPNKFNSVLTRTSPGNKRTVQSFAQAFRNASAQFGVAMKNIQPEFGAYMKYSIYQEVGTMMNRPAPRPHILPAVHNNASEIVRELQSYTMNFLQQTIGKNVSSARYESVYEKAWMRVLNGKVRITAVDLAKAQGVWQYGFHVRSIAGYSRPRSHAEIRSIQQEAEAQRKALSRKGKKK